MPVTDSDLWNWLKPKSCCPVLCGAWMIRKKPNGEQFSDIREIWEMNFKMFHHLSKNLFTLIIEHNLFAPPRDPIMNQFCQQTSKLLQMLPLPCRMHGQELHFSLMNMFSHLLFSKYLSAGFPFYIIWLSANGLLLSCFQPRHGSSKYQQFSFQMSKRPLWMWSGYALSYDNWVALIMLERFGVTLVTRAVGKKAKKARRRQKRPFFQEHF